MQIFAPNQEEINKKLYLKAPTQCEIESFFKEADIKPRLYEKYMGIRIGTFVDVKRGYRKLPIKFWHLIFNKITNKSELQPLNLKMSTQKRKSLCNSKNSTEILDKLSGLKG